MSPTRTADVIVPVHRSGPIDLRCLEAVLERSGPALNRLIVVNDHGPESSIAGDLERFAGRDSRVRILTNVHRLGYAGTCNRGLMAREGDAALLAPDCTVTDDWLLELAAVAHSEERTACASPLTNVGGRCSVPELNRYRAPDLLDGEEVRAACSGLPRWTIAPLLTASCIYLRGDVIDAVGLLVTSRDPPSDAVDEWVSRAQLLGFSAKRANRVFVRGSHPDPGSAATDPGRVSPTEDHLRYQLERFHRSLDGHLAAHAVEVHCAGKIRVALDIRYLPYEEVGTRTSAVGLAQTLARVAGVDLTLIVRKPAQARGLIGRVVTEAQWPDDVAVIHRPAQVFDREELPLLIGSSAHLVITYQDLIGYRIPQVFPNDESYDAYRTTSTLSLPAAQRILAYSDSAASEITSEFGIPRGEIVVVPLGVDVGWFERRDEDDVATRWGLGLPDRYFLSLATDFPHKNLPNLLNAYAILRSRWRDGEPPGLVLAGHATSSRTGFYGRLESGPMGQGLTYLGAVSPDQVRVLYQNALALVFPSLYEGFGLPPLEAMAAGTPVIAMPISSVPEVVGDSALYAGGLSSRDLARAMESVASDEGLQAELRDRGLRHVARFRWENTARATVEAYRSAIRDPSPRSLQMRRHLQGALMCWDQPVLRTPVPEPARTPAPPGIRNAWRSLTLALNRRLRRELGRLEPTGRRKSA